MTSLDFSRRAVARQRCIYPGPAAVSRGPSKTSLTASWRTNISGRQASLRGSGMLVDMAICPAREQSDARKGAWRGRACPSRGFSAGATASGSRSLFAMRMSRHMEPLPRLLWGC